MGKDDQRPTTPKRAEASIESWSRAVVGRFRGKRRVIQLSQRAERDFSDILADFFSATGRRAIPEARRMAMILHFYVVMELSASEIAKLLGMELKTVENILARLIRLLKSQIQYEEV